MTSTLGYWWEKKRKSNIHAYHNRSGITFPMLYFFPRLFSAAEFIYMRIYIIFNKFLQCLLFMPTYSSHFIAKNIWAMPLNSFFLSVSYVCILFIKLKYLGWWQMIGLNTFNMYNFNKKNCAQFFFLYLENIWNNMSTK